jgi:hypothetical protein
MQEFTRRFMTGEAPRAYASLQWKIDMKRYITHPRKIANQQRHVRGRYSNEEYQALDLKQTKQSKYIKAASKKTKNRVKYNKEANRLELTIQEQLQYCVIL